MNDDAGATGQGGGIEDSDGVIHPDEIFLRILLRGIAGAKLAVEVGDLERRYEAVLIDDFEGVPGNFDDDGHLHVGNLNQVVKRIARKTLEAHGYVLSFLQVLAEDFDLARNDVGHDEGDVIFHFGDHASLTLEMTGDDFHVIADPEIFHDFGDVHGEHLVEECIGGERPEFNLVSFDAGDHTFQSFQIAHRQLHVITVSVGDTAFGLECSERRF